MLRTLKSHHGWRVLVAALIATPQAAAGAQARHAAAPDASIEVASFDSAWSRIRATYYDSTMHGVDWDALRGQLRARVAAAGTRSATRDAIGDMISRLGDSHFAVLPSEAVSRGPAGDAGETPADVGVELRLLDGSLMVTEVDSSGSAARAGVHAGWTLAAVDGDDVAARLASLAPLPPGHARRVASLHLAMDLAHRLAGAPGTTVRATFRDGAGGPHELTLERRPTPGDVVHLGALPPLTARLEWRRLATPGDCIGVVRFNIWMTPIAPMFENALRALAGCRGIVLDLRGNIGGVAAMVMGMSGYFFPDTVLLGTLRFRDANLRYAANPRTVASDGSPLEPYAGAVAVLLDAQSASTTEIFAAALQQLGRARVFGDTSAGQALPSLLERLPNGDGLLYAIADFVAPGGRRLEGTGVIPDTPIRPSRAALLAGRDPVLDAAVQWAALSPRAPAWRAHQVLPPQVSFP